ncbi:DUF2333 family protein [Alteromonas sp. a30]|uniref:DUF2333 family protein n=1 Tax=Alteromonas sp. a30 TaxID=2730917 RepID=UPI00227E2F91|nr:DUF2333 family protein [Alteromonas sp. a30]MCY7296547.1 DUF2333 family protein [Alteromonas sp. a30]
MREWLGNKWAAMPVILILLLLIGLGMHWSSEPDTFGIRKKENAPSGEIITQTLIDVAETLLNKPGGFLSNDVLPPSLFLDNMPSWEFGALEMTRDLALAMRKDFSRSQSQSIDNPQLVIAQPKFNIDHRSWLIPSAESQYQDGIDALTIYKKALSDSSQGNAQFFTRADNLRDWLKQVEKRLGSLSQKLSASVGQERMNTDLAGDAQARQSTPNADEVRIRTSWWKIDNNFYEARGACWALLHFLKAVEIDFADVLEKKNARVSLQQIIRELEATQQAIWSPVIVNGSGFGVLANHSLVMANYISRANAALIDLTELLTQG